MSRYRCPLFGQGDEFDLESPENGIPLSHKELIPGPITDLGGYYPVAIPRDQMAEFQADFSIPSVARWFWRVRDWTADIYFNSNGVDPHEITGSFTLKGHRMFGGLEFEDEAELHDPLATQNAHWREWKGEALSLGGPGGNDAFHLSLFIGSFGAEPPTPTLNELFLEHTDGNFSPRVKVEGSVTVSELVDTVIVEFSNPNLGLVTPRDWTLTIDGLEIPDPKLDHPYGSTITLNVVLTPSLFWSWDGIWDTTTGEAISNPRVPHELDEP